jgi:hypothetical protein
MTTCLFIWEPVGASVKLVHHTTWIKSPVANCFVTDCSLAVTPIFVSRLWCHFETDHFISWCSFPLLFGCVWMLCFLGAVIFYMHSSLLWGKNYCSGVINWNICNINLCEQMTKNKNIYKLYQIAIKYAHQKGDIANLFLFLAI